MITVLLPLVLSPTIGQLGRPLSEETSFTLHIQQCNRLFENFISSFFCIMLSKLPLSFFYVLVWTYKKYEVTLLSDIRQRPVFPDVQILPRSFATPHA